jgi:molybdopterin-guanine dinucleotide biosynthesis protein A
VTETRASQDVRGVVLAGGESTRFENGNKALATCDGEPLVARAASAVRRATGEPPMVAIRTAAQAATYDEVLDAQFVRDAPSAAGPLAGVLGAAAAVDTDWLFVCGCDMPRLSPAAIRWLGGHRASALDAVAPRHPDGTRDPLHTFLRREAVERVRGELPAHGGVRALLAALDRDRAVPVDAAPAGVPLADSLTNVNTTAELRAVGA